MRLLTRLVVVEKTLADHLHIHQLSRMPRVRRLLHPKTRRHLLGVSLGGTLMLTGSYLATHAHGVSEVVPLPHVLIDTIAYFIHGVGSVPLIQHIEPLWAILAAD
jgi:hypothetical protein